MLIMVINNTWRRTKVEASREGVILTHTGPFGLRRFEWNGSDIKDVRLEPTTTYADRNHLGEVQLDIVAHPPVKLFTDHAYRDLEPIAAALREAIYAHRR